MAENPYANFIWREVKPGIWERDVDESEQAYASLAKLYEASGRMFFAITGHISLTVTLSPNLSIEEEGIRVEQALRNAWIRLRHDHPTIASRVDFDHQHKKLRKSYTTLPNDDRGNNLESWLKSTFRTVSTDLTGIEWCNSDPPAPDFPTIFVITSRRSDAADTTVLRRDIVLRSPHDILDGMGTLHLFNNLFIHASKAYSLQSSYVVPCFGTEWVNLSPPLRVAAATPPTLTESQKLRLDEARAHNASLQTGIEIACIPVISGVQLPGRHQRVDRKLSTKRTLRLLTACKELGVTPTHVYHAAIAMVVRDLQKRRERERFVRYIAYCLINERQNCECPFNTPKHAAAVYHSSSGKRQAIDLRVPASNEVKPPCENDNEIKEEFLQTVLLVKEFYQQSSRKEHIELIASHWAASALPFPLSPLPVPNPNPLPSITLSSMGIVDRVISPRHGDFQLHDPWVTGEELRTDLGLFLGSWTGSLTLSGVFNDAWHNAEEVLGILQSCESIAFKGLGILFGEE
ncbi:hypothetical protein V8C35DRAFT_333426 [Trichoderma chlorosporum]